MLKKPAARDVGSYILFLSETVIADDIAEEIAYNKPNSNVRQVSRLAEFIDAISGNCPIEASFIELDLLGGSWDAALDRLRKINARIVLFGDAAEDLADRHRHIDGTSFLLRPYNRRDVAALLCTKPDC